MKILIVEDSIAMRRVIRNTISRFYPDTTYEEAQNGTEALDILKLEPIDFVITDWIMPVFDGIELTKEIRETLENKTLPILMITTKGSKADIIEAIQAGVNDYLVKPLSPNILEAKLKALVEKFELNKAN
jgi:two-component system chemotaxis response regulator CheY